MDEGAEDRESLTEWEMESSKAGGSKDVGWCMV